MENKKPWEIAAEQEAEVSSKKPWEIAAEQEQEAEPLKKKASSEATSFVPTPLNPTREVSTSQLGSGGLGFPKAIDEIASQKLHTSPKILSSNKDRPDRNLLDLRNKQLIKLGEQSVEKVKSLEEAYKTSPTEEIEREYNKELSKLQYYDKRYKETFKQLETAPLGVEESIKNSASNIATSFFA